jgi:hypothetical protein
MSLDLARRIVDFVQVGYEAIVHVTDGKFFANISILASGACLYCLHFKIRFLKSPHPQPSPAGEGVNVPNFDV